MPLTRLVEDLIEATASDANEVITAPENSDGRTGFFWIVMSDGELILGVKPRGILYEGIVDKALSGKSLNKD